MVFSFGFAPSSGFISRYALKMSDLDTGDFEDVKFEKVADIGNIGKYKLEATLPASEMNTYLNEYKDEMKRRKVSFPGFRPGKLPPFVMGDVRKYLVSYGLEMTLGQLCNYNSLVICDDTGAEVTGFGEDEFYSEIVKEDFRGFNFEQQRDAWKEGTDLSFTAEFCAKVEGGDENGAASATDTNAVDVEKIQ